MTQENIIVESPWTEGWSVGHHLIDQEHKQLFEFVNLAERYAASEDSVLSEQFHELLNDVCIYARNHFSTEERLLERIRYSNLIEHIKEHEMMSDKLTEYLIAATSNRIDMKEFARFIREWMMDHLLNHDMKYKDEIA